MKILSNKEVETLIRESIDEIRQLGGAPTQTKQATAANDPYATYKFAKSQAVGGYGLSPTCLSVYYEEMENGYEVPIVRIGWVHQQHKTDFLNFLNQNYSDILSAVDGQATARQQSKLSSNAPNPIDIKIFPGKEQDFINILPAIANELGYLSSHKGGFYTKESIVNFPTSVKCRLIDAPSKKDYETAESRMVDNIEELLRKVQNLGIEDIKMLGLIGTSRTTISKLDLTKAEAAGYRLRSTANVMQIKAQLPNATFVTNAWTWEHMFNRTVNDPTQFALITKPFNGKKRDTNADNKAAAKVGYGDPTNPSIPAYDNFKAALRGKQLSNQQEVAVKFLSNIYNPNETSFITEKVFDVANTTVIPGKQDVWNETIGLSDNLRGIPNALAQQANMTASEENAEEFEKLQALKQTDIDLNDVVTAMANVYRKQVGPAPVNNGSTGDRIAGIAYHYGEFICKQRNIVHPNIVSGICAGYAVLMALEFGCSVGSMYGSKISPAIDKFKFDPEYRQKMAEVSRDWMEFYNDVEIELNKISNKRVKERNTLKATSQQVQAAPQADDAEQSVVAENIDEAYGKPLGRSFTFDEVYNFLTGQKALEENIEEDVIEEVQENLQESFYNLLDRMERING